MPIDKNAYVAVLMGGVSTEREVSLHSGQGVAEGLRQAGYDVFEAVVDDNSLSSIEGLDIDVAFIALHGVFGEDGRIQELLEAAGIPYNGSGPEASRNALDKVLTKRMFTEAEIPTAAYLALGEAPDEMETDVIFAQLGPKVVIKPSLGGSSIGVSIVERAGFRDGLEAALRYDGRVIVEKYVKGRELTVGVLGDRTLPIVELLPHREFFDYTAKYQHGQTDYVVAPKLPRGVAQRVNNAALDAFRRLGCRDLARVDVMLAENGDLAVLEVNTIPGFTETSLVPKAAAAAGLAFPALCRTIVEMALSRGAAVRPVSGD